MPQDALYLQSCISNFMSIGQGVLELQDENQTQPKREFGTIGESLWNRRASLNSHNSGSRWLTVLGFWEDNHPVVPWVHAKFRVGSVKLWGDSRQGFAPHPCNFIPSETENFIPLYLGFLSSYWAQILRGHPFWKDEEGFHRSMAQVSNFWWYQIRISNFDETDV